MYPVSSAYLEAVKGDGRIFPTHIKFDGISSYITNKNIRKGTYTNTIDGNSVLTMGNACANKIEFTIANFDKSYTWKGSRFTVEKGLNVNGTAVWVPWGTFWVADVSTSNNKKTIDITGYDLMYTLSKQAFETKLTPPFHYCDLLNAFMRETGLVISHVCDLPTSDDEDYIITQWPDGDISRAQMAGYLAGMVGCNARIAWDNPAILEFTWWDDEETGVTVYKETRMNGFEKLADSALCVGSISTGNEIEYPSAYPKLTFTLDDETQTASVALIESYRSDTEPITIPASIRIDENTVYTVTTIAAYGFYKSQASSITIPETITTMKSSAFGCCPGITSANLTGVTYLGASVFANCPNIESAYVPNDINWSDWLGYGTSEVFENCTGLVKVITNCPQIRHGMFKGCTSLTTVLCNNTTDIENQAFANCTSLKQIILPNTVKNLYGYQTFYGCTALEYVQIGTSDACVIEGIYHNTFEECTSLQTIAIYKKADEISGAPWGGPSDVTVEWLG